MPAGLGTGLFGVLPMLLGGGLGGSRQVGGGLLDDQGQQAASADPIMNLLIQQSPGQEPIATGQPPGLFGNQQQQPGGQHDQPIGQQGQVGPGGRAGQEFSTPGGTPGSAGHRGTQEGPTQGESTQQTGGAEQQNAQNLQMLLQILLQDQYSDPVWEANSSAISYQSFIRRPPRLG